MYYEIFPVSLTSLAAGILCGIIVSIPLGPVGLAVIDNGLRKGFWPAFLVGLGGICGETIYAGLMLAGHSSILDHPVLTATVRLVAVLFMGGLGVRYLLYKPEKLAESEVKAQRAVERWHHPRAFLLGFLMTSTNLFLALLWATLAALLLAHGWVGPSPSSRAACAGGVWIGGSLWFFTLAWLVGRAHRRITPRTLTRLVRLCGLILLLLTVFLAWKAFFSQAQLTRTTPGDGGIVTDDGGPRLSTE